MGMAMCFEVGDIVWRQWLCGGYTSLTLVQQETNQVALCRPAMR